MSNVQAYLLSIAIVWFAVGAFWLWHCAKIIRRNQSQEPRTQRKWVTADDGSFTLDKIQMQPNDILVIRIYGGTNEFRERLQRAIEQSAFRSQIVALEGDMSIEVYKRQLSPVPPEPSTVPTREL